MIQHKKELEAYAALRGDLELPEDFDYNIPAVGLAWMLKAGWNDVMIEHYGVGWSAAMGRVVIPIYDEDDDLCGVQSRAVYNDQKPKYLNKTGWGYSSVMFWSDAELMFEEEVAPVWCVLTEDIMSAGRVGRIQPAVASLGTSLTPQAAAAILEQHQKIMIWYDNDDAGIRGANKARRALELQGGDVLIIRTEFDPKKYSNEEITQHIKAML